MNIQKSADLTPIPKFMHTHLKHLPPLPRVCLFFPRTRGPNYSSTPFHHDRQTRVISVTRNTRAPLAHASLDAFPPHDKKKKKEKKRRVTFAFIDFSGGSFQNFPE